MNIEKHEEQIINKFEEIDHKNGLILIESIIDNNYDKNLIKNIILSLSKNKKKYTYEIYDYIIKNTEINYDTILNISEYLFIHLCAINGNIHLLDYLIKKGVDVDSQNKFGITALMLASQYSNHTSSIDIVKLLLDYGADTNSQTIYGKTAYYIAQTNECKDLIKSYMN